MSKRFSTVFKRADIPCLGVRLLSAFRFSRVGGSIPPAHPYRRKDLRLGQGGYSPLLPKGSKVDGWGGCGEGVEGCGGGRGACPVVGGAVTGKPQNIGGESLEGSRARVGNNSG